MFPEHGIKLFSANGDDGAIGFSVYYNTKGIGKRYDLYSREMWVMRRGKKKNVIFHDTVCKAQNSMHDETIKLLDKIDVLFIVGGKDSSNTKAMFEKCEKKRKADCYHVDSVIECKIKLEAMLKNVVSLYEKL